MAYVHGRSLIKIAYAEDNRFLQEAIPFFVDEMENCKVVIQAYSGRELLEKLNQKPDTDLILMDIKMPEMDGVETCKKVKQFFPEIKVLFISNYENELVYLRIFSAKANGFIPKDVEQADLKKAIYTVMRSEYYFHNGFPSIYRNSLNGNGRTHKNWHTITDEELAFLRLACTEMTYEAIALEMKTSKRHVDYIREGLFEKFNLSSRVELALLAYRGGLTA